MTLRLKLLFLFIILAIIPLGLAGRSMIQRTRDEFKSKAHDHLVATANQVIQDVEDFRSAWHTVIQLIKNSVESQEVGIDGKLTLMKEVLASNTTDIVSLQISVSGVPSPFMAVNEEFLAKIAPPENTNPVEILKIDQETIDQCLGESEMYISDPFYLLEAETWLVRLIHRLSAKTFDRPATLCALIHMSQFQKQIHGYKFNEIGKITLATGQNRELIFERGKVGDGFGAVDMPAVETPGQVMTGSRKIENSVVMLGAYGFTRKPELRIAVEMEQGKAYEAIRQMENYLYAWIAVGLLVASAGAFVVSFFLTRPLRKLTDAASRISGGDFDVSIQVGRQKDEIGELSMAFRKMQQNLQKYIEDLKNTTKAKERVESELELAKEIQQNFLPKIFPESQNMDVWGRCYPAREVGGDYFDFFRIDEKHYGMVIGDVTGKGVPAALFMAVSRTLFRMLSIGNRRPDRVLTDFNDHLVSLDSNSNMFITLFYGIINAQTGHIRYSTAGHNMPYINSSENSNGRFYLLPGLKTMVAGMVGGIEMEIAEQRLSRGDAIVLYTDGMTEAINDNDEEFGEERLEALLNRYSHLSAQEMCERIVKDVQAFQGAKPQFDDMTIFILKMPPHPDSKESTSKSGSGSGSGSLSGSKQFALNGDRDSDPDFKV